MAQDEVRDGPCHAVGHGKKCGQFQAWEGQVLMFVCLFVCFNDCVVENVFKWER